MPARLDIALQRNETFQSTWTVADDAGAAIDVTDYTFAMQVKEKASTTLLQAAVIELTAPTTGEITITLDASVGSALHSYANPLWTYELPYDLVMTDPDGVPTALVAGYVTLSRGVTG